MGHHFKSSLFSRGPSLEKSKSISINEEDVLFSKQNKQNETSTFTPIESEVELETVSTTSLRRGQSLIHIFNVKSDPPPTGDKLSKGAILLAVSDIALYFVFSACYTITRAPLQIDDVALDINYSYLSLSSIMCLLFAYVVNNFLRAKDFSLILLYLCSFCPLTYFIITFPFTPKELAVVLIKSYAVQMTLMNATYFIRRVAEYQALKYPEQDELLPKYTFWLELCRLIGFAFGNVLTAVFISNHNNQVIVIATVPVTYYTILVVQTFWMKLFGYSRGERRIVDVYIKCIFRIAVQRCSPTAHDKWKTYAIENYGQKTLEEVNILIAIFCTTLPILGQGIARYYIRKISLTFHAPHIVDYSIFRREHTYFAYEMLLGVSLCVVQLIFVPLCNKNKGITTILIRNIYLGYFFVFLSTLFCFILEIKITGMLGTIPGYEFAEFRIFNSLPNDMYLRSSLFDLKTIKGFEQIIFRNIPINEPNKLALFDSTERSPAIFSLKLSPYKCLVYVITENNTLNSIKYPAPLFRGPRGTNNLRSSRCFLFSPIKNLTGVFIATNLNTSVVKEIKFPLHEDSSVFGVEPGHYKFSFIGNALDRKEINGEHLFPGFPFINPSQSNGVYGILLYFPLNNLTHVEGKFYTIISPLNLPYPSIIGQLLCLAIGEAFMRVSFVAYIMLKCPINCRAVALSWVFFFHDCSVILELFKDLEIRPTFFEVGASLCIPVISVLCFAIVKMRFKL